MTTLSPRPSSCFMLAMAALMGTGCARTGVNVPAYEGIYPDLEKLAQEVSDGRTTIPSIESQFCLRRARADRREATVNSALDSIMLVSAGVLGGFGATVGAATAAMDDVGAKKDWQIAGAATIAASAAVLALRTTLALNDLARTQRIAAANSLDAAVDIITAYALADDPKDVKEDILHVCRDEDINVARAFPGAKDQEVAEKAVAQAVEKSKEASAQVAKSEVTSASADSELKKKSDELEEAKKKVSAAQQTIARGKDGAAEKKAVEANTQAEDLQKQVEELQAKATAARQELLEKRMQAAKAEEEEARARVLAASSRLRRWGFFGTRGDVDQAGLDLKDARDDRQRAHRRVLALQKAIDHEQEPSAGESVKGNASPAPVRPPATKPSPAPAEAPAK